MRLPVASSLAISVVALLANGTTSFAQAEPLPPLPPPPPTAAPPPPATAPSEGPPASPPGAPPPAPPPRVIYAAPPPPEYVYQPPPPGPGSMSEAESVHAPKYSLWLGARLGVLLYFGGMYYTNATTGTEERVSSFVTNGIAPEVDLGARISRRYIPYLALELGFVGPGSRFQGTQATAGTSFVGVGFRFLMGDTSSVSFASDLSLGFRKFQVSNDGSTWTASAFEFLRLGLGADIRFTDYFTISPMITLSGGTVSDTSGSVAFAPNQSDGATGTPPGQIPNWAQTSYVSIVIGCGAHFDLLSSHE